MRRSIAALAVVLFTAGGVALAQSGAVTLVLSQYRDVNGVRTLVFSGVIPNGAAGETVELVGQDCGASGYRLLGGGVTRPGGRWQLENPEHVAPYRTFGWSSGITFRARWNDRLSDPVVLRLPAGISATKVEGRRAWRVSVPSSSQVRMAGKTVELQRRIGSGWVRYRRAKLVHRASFERGPYNNEAVFPVEARGLRLRAFLPQASALPCFLSAATPSWRS
jgi:hypothetical protein